MSGKESRFKSDINHTISKRIVQKAKHTESAIALEDLSNIRKTVRVRKAQRAQHHSWSFRQLRDYIVYKAQRL
jgi:putative transposase